MVEVMRLSVLRMRCCVSWRVCAECSRMSESSAMEFKLRMIGWTSALRVWIVCFWNWDFSNLGVR